MSWKRVFYVLDENHSFINTLFTYKPGDNVTLKVVRGRQTLNCRSRWANPKTK